MLLKGIIKIILAKCCLCYKCIDFKIHEYPVQWKMEFWVPIPKSSVSPESCEDIRIISKTSFFSKVFGSFLVDWMLSYMGPFLDPQQFGGRKGKSVVHYLLQFLKFVHTNLDKRQPHAVIAALIDLSKAFNRVDHTLVIEDLFSMGCPSWLLKVLISYLTNRKHVVTYLGATSNPKMMPSGAPAGCLLGGFLFIAKFNWSFLRPYVERPLKSIHLKYFDDATAGYAVDLKNEFFDDLEIRQRPLT